MNNTDDKNCYNPSYLLCNTRLYSNIVAMRKRFSKSSQIEDDLISAQNSAKITMPSCSEMPEPKVSVLDYEELYLMSGISRLSVSLLREVFSVDLRFMQSARDAQLCFDVFILIRSKDKDTNAAQSLKKLFELYLESLRKTYNGDWHITDDEVIGDEFH